MQVPAAIVIGVLVLMTGRTYVHLGISAMCCQRRIAASRLLKNNRAPEKKKLPILPLEKVKVELGADNTLV